MGQRKSLLTERVILMPGPDEECRMVLWIYDQFIAGSSETDIAAQLNAQGVNNHFGRPWSRGTVCAVLTNEKYVGNNLFNRTSGKMKSRAKPNPENEWVRKDHAFEPVVDMERFYTVQGIYRERNKKATDEELLQGLTKLSPTARKGTNPAVKLELSKSPVSMKTENDGTANRVALEHTRISGKARDIGLNHNYLTQYVKSLETDTVSMKLFPRAISEVVVFDTFRYQHLLMPMRD